MLVDPPSPPWQMENLQLFSTSLKWFLDNLKKFLFFPLKDQKYLENSHFLAQRMVVEGGEGGGYIREKNKSV